MSSGDPETVGLDAHHRKVRVMESRVRIEVTEATYQALNRAARAGRYSAYGRRAGKGDILDRALAEMFGRDHTPTQYAVSVSAEVHARVAAAAEARGCSMGTIVDMALEPALGSRL